MAEPVAPLFFSAEASLGWKPVRRRQPELLAPDLLATRSGYLLSFREHGRRPDANSTVRPILYVHGWAGSRNEYFGQTSLTLDRTAPSRLGSSGGIPVGSAGLNFGPWDALQLAQRRALDEHDQQQQQQNQQQQQPQQQPPSKPISGDAADAVFRRIAEDLQEDPVYVITVSRRGYDQSGLAPPPMKPKTKDSKDSLETKDDSPEILPGTAKDTSNGSSNGSGSKPSSDDSSSDSPKKSSTDSATEFVVDDSLVDDSDMWDRLTGYQVFATQVVDLLSVLGIRGGVSVVGWSAGGPYAMAVARYVGGHPAMAQRLLNRMHIASRDVDPEDEDNEEAQAAEDACCEIDSPSSTASSSSSGLGFPRASTVPTPDKPNPKDDNDVDADEFGGDCDADGCGMELDCQLGLAGRGCSSHPFYVQTLSLVCSDPAWAQAPALLRANRLQAWLFRQVRGDPEGFARRLLRMYHAAARPAIWMLALVNRLGGARAQLGPLELGQGPARPPRGQGVLGALVAWLRRLLFWWPSLQLWERRLRAAAARRVEGCVADMRTERSDWGFRPRDIVGVPVTLWHGREDGLVPAAASAWLARQLKAGAPELRLRVFPGEAHNLMEFRWTQIITEILRQQFLWRDPRRLERDDDERCF